MHTTMMQVATANAPAAVDTAAPSAQAPGASQAAVTPATNAASTSTPGAPVATGAAPAYAAGASESTAVVADASTATVAHAGTTAAANPPTTKPVTGVTFPVRPATTASTQAASKPVGHASAADAGSVGGALFSLVLVVGLILALGWLAKRMPGLQRGAGSSSLKVVASVALGPRDRAVVVDVGGTQLLLGVGQGGVRTLHTLERPLPVAEAPNSPSPFAQILAQHFGKKS